jgi:hypothetical protein
VDPKKKAKKQKEEQRTIAAIQNSQRVLAALNLRVTLVVGVTMIAIFYALNSHFSGVVVAKLPFEPFALITAVSHRNLPGDDLTVRGWVGPGRCRALCMCAWVGMRGGYRVEGTDAPRLRPCSPARRLLCAVALSVASLIHALRWSRPNQHHACASSHTLCSRPPNRTIELWQQDCSLPFLYALCSMGIKASLVKLVGGTPPTVSKHVPTFFEMAQKASGVE